MSRESNIAKLDLAIACYNIKKAADLANTLQLLALSTYKTVEPSEQEKFTNFVINETMAIIRKQLIHHMDLAAKEWATINVELLK